MAPARFDTRHVYLPLSSGRRFFRLSVHFFLCSPASKPVKAWSSFIHMMSGRGCPLATHLSRTELPTGRAITRRLILEGCVKRGRAAGRGGTEVSKAPGRPAPPPAPEGKGDAGPISPHCLPAGSSWPPEGPSCPRRSLPGPVSSAETRAREKGPSGPHPDPSLGPSWESSRNTTGSPWEHTHISESQRQLGRAARPAYSLGAGDPNRAGRPPPLRLRGVCKARGRRGPAPPAAAVTLAHIKAPRPW